MYVRRGETKELGGGGRGEGKGGVTVGERGGGGVRGGRQEDRQIVVNLCDL